jgi:hypothetical protein
MPKIIWYLATFFVWLMTFTPSERVALGAAFLVFVGVVAEYVAEIPAIEKRKRLETAIKRLSMAILMLGLGGDVLGIVMGQAEMAELTKVAGDAKNSAHAAAGDAATAKTEAGGADTEAKAADKEADEARDKVKGVAEQADQIGGVLGETIGLVNARRVQDMDKLSAELKKHFKGRNIQVVSYVGDAEAFGLCTQLLKVAKDAEMVPEDICGKAWFTSPLITILSIAAPSADEALEISQPLLTIGKLGSGSTVGSAIVIFVGVKTPFVIGETAQTRDAERSAAAMKKNNRKPKAKH